MRDMETVLNYRRSTGRWALILTVLIAGTAVLVLQSVILAILAPAGVDRLLALQLSFDGATFNAIKTGLSQVGIDAIMAHFPFDFVLIFFYAAGGFALMSLIMTPKPRAMDSLSVLHRVSLIRAFRGLRRVQGLRILPILAALCDIVENVLEIGLLKNIVPAMDSTVLPATLLSISKWSFLALACIVGLASIWYRIKHRHFVRK